MEPGLGRKQSNSTLLITPGPQSPGPDQGASVSLNVAPRAPHSPKRWQRPLSRRPSFWRMADRSLPIPKSPSPQQWQKWNVSLSLAVPSTKCFQEHNPFSPHTVFSWKEGQKFQLSKPPLGLSDHGYVDFRVSEDHSWGVTPPQLIGTVDNACELTPFPSLCWKTPSLLVPQDELCLPIHSKKIANGSNHGAQHTLDWP